MINVQNVTKSFNGIEIIKGVSFEIQKGEVVGFLGQNGAGKTTLMRILTSFLPATTGKVTVMGKDIASDSLAVRRKIGYLPETPPLYPNMIVKDYLIFAAQLKDVLSKDIPYQLEKVMAECGIEHVAHKVIGTLSKGYKQRVGIAQAIINDPEILILDEPTSGLDPVQIQTVRQLIEGFKGKKTVILSTHILSEIEQTAQRVLIIKDGRILADDALDHLLKTHHGMNLEEIFLNIVKRDSNPTILKKT